MKDKRILVVIPYIDSVPLKGFEVLLKNHIDELVRHYSVDIICLKRLDGRTTDFNHPNIDFTSVDVNILDKIMGLFLCMVHLFPFQSAPFVNPKFTKVLGRLVNTRDYEQVLCYMSRTYPALELVKPKEKKFSLGVYAIDPLALSYYKLRLSAQNMMSLAYRAEGWLMKRLDRKIISDGHRFALISDSDRHDYLNFLGIAEKNTIDIVPYAVDHCSDHLDINNKKAGRAIVTGSGNYRPNQVALQYLLKDIWPLIDEDPILHLDIAGKGHPKDIVDLANSLKSVNFLGFVANLEDELCRANFALCLVALDIGVQTKVLEAMAVGTPIVCSSASNKGVHGVNGVHLLIADNPEEVVLCIRKLMANPDLFSSISTSSQNFVRSNFDWNVSSQKLIEFLSRDNQELHFRND
jgi:glycosyltransferase involved in cell wall biosynthesis